MNRAMTGIRPTGDLTIANYLGAMEPITELQDSYDGEVSIFVADMHGLTDQEPHVIARNTLNTARSLIAAGVDPERTTIYLQSQLEAPTLGIKNILDRHTTVAELSRVPTLKDKLRANQGPESATLSLFGYPVLMAADILVQDATHVPVGKDQLPHIEFARRVSRRFNNQYGKGESIFVTPQALSMEGLSILALDGKGKMSKSSPNGAIFLNDGPDDVREKVNRAVTGPPNSDLMQSHFALTRAVCEAPEALARLEVLATAHNDGERVIKDFKPFMADQLNGFLAEFQKEYNNITDNKVVSALQQGGQKALEQANMVNDRAHTAMGILGIRGLMAQIQAK